MSTMCDGCSVEHNREQWAKYPEMMDVCKLCKSFQLAIEEAIEQAQKIINKLDR